jgi:hypothetical protein
MSKRKTQRVELLSPAQAAAECGCNLGWLREQLRAGKLAAIQQRGDRRQWHIKRSDFEAWRVGYRFVKRAPRKQQAEGKGNV